LGIYSTHEYFNPQVKKTIIVSSKEKLSIPSALKSLPFVFLI